MNAVVTRSLCFAGLLAGLLTPGSAQERPADPRVGLKPGLKKRSPGFNHWQPGGVYTLSCRTISTCPA